MPDLSADELDALRADIAAHGIIVPIVKDQHGRILDGNHRAAIAAELGITCPVTLVDVADDDDAIDKAVSINCARRHLNREQVRALTANEIRRRPDDSDRAIARRVGCSPTTVGTVRAEVRREAEELTEQIRDVLDRMIDQAAAAAVLQHRKGACWQSVGDVLERTVRGQLSKLDSDFGVLSCSEFWGPLMGEFFDEVRATECPPACEVCTTTDRQWRAEHPGQVYRWAQVSNLDTKAVTS